MLNSEILEVAVGLIFVFLIASLLASAVREMIESGLKTRAVQLERGIRALLDDPSGVGVTKEVFHHSLVYSLFTGTYHPEKQLTSFWNPFAAWKHRHGHEDDPDHKPHKRLRMASNLPAYIPSRNFAVALMHVVGADAGGLLTLDSLRANAMCLPPGRVRDAVLAAVSEAQGDLDRARTSLEAWFDGNMDRVSGWYKRETQYVLFAIGVILAVALNINSLSVAHDLATNNTLRQQTVLQAEGAMKSGAVDPAKQGATTEEKKAQRAVLMNEVQDLSGLIGWPRFDLHVSNLFEDRLAKAAAAKEPPLSAEERAKAYTGFWWLQWWLSIPGWLVTAIAISLGAPFWFDLLNKIMVIRSTVKPYEKSGAEGSEDRKGGGPSAAQKLAPAPVGSVAVAPPPPPAGPTLADTIHVRLAIEAPGLDAGTMKVFRDADEFPGPSTGFIELEMAVDTTQTLKVTGKRKGKVVSWSQALTPHLNSDGQPLLATL